MGLDSGLPVNVAFLLAGIVIGLLTTLGLVKFVPRFGTQPPQETASALTNNPSANGSPTSQQGRYKTAAKSFRAVFEGAQLAIAPSGRVRYVHCIGWVLVCLLAVLILLPLSAVFGFTLGHVEGHSMSPQTKDGAAILVRRVDPRSLRVGDIVAFRRDGQLILHRIIGRGFREDGALVFTTKGDANSAADPSVLASEVKARVVLTMPVVGGALDSFTRVLSHSQLLVLAAVLVVVCAVVALSGRPVRPGKP